MANIPLICVDQKMAWEPVVENTETSEVKKQETNKYYSKKGLEKKTCHLQKHLQACQASNASGH